MKPGRALLLTAALGALPVLSGCVAAVVPVAVAGMTAKKKLEKKQAKKAQEQGQAEQQSAPADSREAAPPLEKTPVAVPAAPQRVPVFADAGGIRASLAPTALVGAASPPSAEPRLYTVSEPPALPPVRLPETTVIMPAASPAPPERTQMVPARPVQRSIVSASTAAPKSSGYLGLTAYTISHATSPESSSALAVIDPADPLSAPRRAQCGGLAPAVMIDLDPGLAVFDPAAAHAEPGLADALTAIRASGVTVLWISALQVEQAERVHAALARTGLDPARTDRLLLLKGAGDRKQARRNSAARNWCVIAMAGDRRGDFDEAFDYLRDPEATIPADSLIGDGWFIAPAPLP